MRNIITRAKWYIVSLLVCLVGLVGFFVWQSSPMSNDVTPVRVAIPAGWNARDIAARLHEKGLIRNELLFRLTVRVGGQADLLKPGAYDFRPNMSLFDIIHKISSGEVAAVWVTIPEGYTIRQIGHLLQEKRIISDSAVFIDQATNGGQNFTSIAPVYSSNLEGYLFPDTYLFMPGSDAGQVLNEMLHNFKNKAVDSLATDVGNSVLAASYTLGEGVSDVAKWHTILTVAAMIEREAKLPSERPLVSAVIWNRLNKGMRLEIDATVLYAMRRHKSRLTYADLKINDPYNTYYVRGLPAGPIGNPGLDSIKAALNPARVDYLFYVADASRGDGSHIFTRTLAEHNRAKIRVRRSR